MVAAADPCTRQTVRDAEVSNAQALCATLTGRETEVLMMLGKGLTYAECAKALEISLETVKSYSRTVREKLSVNRVVEAAVIAAKAGLL